MVKETYKQFKPGRREKDTGIPIENYTPLNWELALLMFGRRFGLLPEYIDNIHTFHASGIETILIEQSRKVNDFQKMAFSQEKPSKFSEKYSIICGESTRILSLASARAALSIFSDNKGNLVSTVGKEAEIEEDLSEFLPDEGLVRQMIEQDGLSNSAQIIQAYRILFSMGHTMFSMLIGEDNISRNTFKNDPEIYLSSLAYFASTANTALAEELKGIKFRGNVLPSYLMENRAEALSNIFFTVDLSEAVPDYLESHILTHLVTIHSRLMGMIGDTILIKKMLDHPVISKSINKVLPFGWSPFHKDDLLTKLLYNEGKFNWFNLVHPLPDLFPLLTLIQIEGMPHFSKNLGQLRRDEKIALQAAWKSGLRILADNIHDGINISTYLQQLQDLFKQSEETPAPNKYINPTRIVDKLIDLKLQHTEEITRALDPSNFNVPNSYKIRFFVEDEYFNKLVNALKKDVLSAKPSDKYQPFLLLVDPVDQGKTVQIPITEINDARTIIEEQFKKGGRAMLFVHLFLPTLTATESTGRVVDIQFTLMSKTADFINQRTNYGKARLYGSTNN